MKTVVRFTLVLVTVAATLGMSGCTGESTRAVLTVVSLNEGGSYFSDLINVADPLNPYIPADAVKVTLGNIPNTGSAPLAPNTPFSEIVVTGYTVTYNPPVYSPVTGGLTLRVPSGSTADGMIAISNLTDKAAYAGPPATTTATVTFTGYNRINGANNGDAVTAVAHLTVQVADFGDE